MEKWVGRVALVTGASVGIGFDLCKKLVSHGMKVVGCARNIETIENLSKTASDGSLRAIKCDVSKEDEVKSMFENIKREYGRLDVCINNAGLSRNCSVIDGKVEDMREIFEVNVIGLSMVTQEALRLMRDQAIDDGHIINLSSLSGHRIIKYPPGAIYTASKFAVRTLTECLRQELREIKSGIRVSCVSPGMVRTEFFSRAFGEEAGKAFDNQPALEAEAVTDAVLYCLSVPPGVQIHDVLMRDTHQVA